MTDHTRPDTLQKRLTRLHIHPSISHHHATARNTTIRQRLLQQHRTRPGNHDLFSVTPTQRQPVSQLAHTINNRARQAINHLNMNTSISPASTSQRDTIPRTRKRDTKNLPANQSRLNHSRLDPLIRRNHRRSRLATIPPAKPLPSKPGSRHRLMLIRHSPKIQTPPQRRISVTSKLPPLPRHILRIRLVRNRKLRPRKPLTTRQSLPTKTQHHATVR